MAYEQGMKIDYNTATKEVSVSFRGDRATLPARYNTEDAAIRAGEEFCRGRGWKN